MNINEQQRIYVQGEYGTWIRVNELLYENGLSKEKKIVSDTTMNFIRDFEKGKYEEKYSKADVIILDEFYDWTMELKYYETLNKIIDSGKQIVMAGHGNLNTLNEMPEEFKNKTSEYKIKYSFEE